MLTLLGTEAAAIRFPYGAPLLLRLDLTGIVEHTAAIARILDDLAAELAARENNRPGGLTHRPASDASRKCKAAVTGRFLIDVLSDLFIVRGVPGHIRSDNGPEFIAKSVREWISSVGASTAYIEPGSPWEKGYCESFNSKLRDELLNGEIFYILKEAQVIIESWRCHYNTLRPNSSLGYKPPAPEAALWPAAQPGPATPATTSLALKAAIN